MRVIDTNSREVVFAHGSMMPVGMTQAEFQALVDQANQAANDALTASEAATEAATDASAAAARAEGAAELDSRAYAVSSAFRPVAAPNKIRVAGYAAQGDGGAAVYVRVASAPAHGAYMTVTTLGGAQVIYALAEPVVWPEMFGGFVGPSNADAAINTMIAYQRATGAAIDGNNRWYRLNSTLTLPTDYAVQARNLFLNGTAIPLNGLFTTPVAQQLNPSPTNETPLSADVGSNATSVTVANSSAFSADDWVLLRSNKIMAETEVSGDATRHSRACELLQVASSSGGVITFRTRTQDGYAVVDAATIAKVQTAGRVIFENVKIIGADTSFYTTDSFESSYLLCNFSDMSSRGLFEDRCYRTTGDLWTFSSKATLPAFTQAPYGLCYMSSQNGSYGRVRGHRIRHLTTTGSNQSSRGRSVSRGNVLGDIYATDCFAAPVDQHPGGGFIQVGNVFVTFADNASQKVACQFQGGGGQVGSVEANNGAVLQFDCFGFYQNNFTPYVYIASGRSRNAPQGVRVLNLTNRYGTGQAQAIRFNIGNADFYVGVGVEVTPTSGVVEGGVDTGHITALTSLGNGRCVYSTVTSDGYPALRFGNVNMRAQTGARVIQLDGGNMQMLGGSISGVGGSAEVRLSDAVLSLIGTTETALTETLIGSSAIRRVSFS